MYKKIFQSLLELFVKNKGRVPGTNELRKLKDQAKQIVKEREKTKPFEGFKPEIVKEKITIDDVLKGPVTVDGPKGRTTWDFSKKKGDVVDLFATEKEFISDLYSMNQNFIKNDPMFNLELATKLRNPGVKTYGWTPSGDKSKLLSPKQRQTALDKLKEVMKHDTYQTQHAEELGYVDLTDDIFTIEKAEGGIARLGFGKGKLVKGFFEFVEQLFIKASNDIRLGRGKWKGLDQKQKTVQHDNLTKKVTEFQKSGKTEGLEVYFDVNPNEAFAAAEKKALLKKYQTENPNIKLSYGDKDSIPGDEGIMDAVARGNAQRAEKEALKQKYPGVTDDLLEKILIDDNPQRKAEVLATMDEYLKLREVGKGEEEAFNIVVDSFQKPTKHAEGGRVPLFKGKLIKGIGSLIKKGKKLETKSKIPQKVEGKIWKNVEGETQVIGMGDMAHSEEMNTAVVKGMALSDAMKKMALDPSSLSDYNKFNELVEAGMKGFDPAIRQQIIRAKYGDVVGKELLENMVANADDSHRLATVMGTIDEGMAMSQKGMHPDEIIETIKESWKRKPQAEGGRVPLMYGGDPGFAFEYGGSWADWHDQHRNTMPVEQYIQTKLPKARLPFREMQSGGLAYMLGEPTYMKYGAGGSVGHAPWHKPTGQPQQQPQPQPGGAPGGGRPDPMKAPRGLPSLAPRTMDPAFMQQQAMQKMMMGQGQPRMGMQGQPRMGMAEGEEVYGPPEKEKKKKEKEKEEEEEGKMRPPETFRDPHWRWGLRLPAKEKPGTRVDPSEGIGFGSFGDIDVDMSDPRFQLGRYDPEEDYYPWEFEVGKDSGRLTWKRRFNQGGRIGFGLGSIDKGRRAFMKWLAGLTGAGIAAGSGLLKFGKAAKVVPKVTETITRGADGMPAYITDLIQVVKAKGTKDFLEGVKRTDYSTVHSYKGVDVIEDGAGNIRIKKPTTGVAEDASTGKSYEGISQEVEMEITKGGYVKNKQGKMVKEGDEYFEGTVRPDRDGKMKDIVEEIDEADHLDLKKIADEINVWDFDQNFYKNIKPHKPTKKASGGIAYALGE